MKIAFYTTVEGYRRHCESWVEDRSRAVANAEEQYNTVIAGTHRRAWLSANNIVDGTAVADDAWNRRIEWARDYLKKMQRDLRKAKRELEKALQMERMQKA